MTVRTRNQLMAFSIIAAPFVFFFCLLLFWDAEPLPPVPPLPNPNGYENLVKAGNMVSNDFADYDELTSANLREMVNKDAGAFQIARTGLQQECRVTLDYSVTSSAHLDQLAALKRLAFAFVAEGRLAEMEKRPGDAAKSFLDTIRLGNASARGGVIIDQLVGTAIESIGVGNLQKLIEQLDAKSCRETAATLETLDSQRQTWNEVMQQERDWSRRTFPGIRNEIGRIAMRRTLQTAFKTAEEKFDAQIEKIRQLTIDLAARAYQLDKGHPPANLTDLVPDYLKAVPQDPLTGTNMVYSP
ncbi:MAG TPA: hypothetical protein VJT54_06560 [Verrucomicrobiae bacterium]|nr:hypothetical protein [Verrucomicrobiae bacterium]